MSPEVYTALSSTPNGAATHQNLEMLVRQGRFREDLFYRLNVIRIQLPTLSERREDIPRLAAFFLQQSARELGMAPRTLSPQVQQHLAQWDWPGNVRQPAQPALACTGCTGCPGSCAFFILGTHCRHRSRF